MIFDTHTHTQLMENMIELYSSSSRYQEAIELASKLQAELETAFSPEATERLTQVERILAE